MVGAMIPIFSTEILLGPRALHTGVGNCSKIDHIISPEEHFEKQARTENSSEK
jgi:hypothetical protein